MMNEQMVDKFNEIMTDEKYIDEAKNIREPAQMQKFLADKGLNISIEDIVTIAKAFTEGITNGEELSEEELETVAGGRRGHITASVFGLGLSIFSGNWWAVPFFALALYGSLKGY